MIRPPRPLDPSRACPLILSVNPLPGWETLADREGAILATLDAPLSAVRAEACRRYAIDPGRIFLVGSEAPELLAHVSAATSATDTDAWETLLKRAKPALAREKTGLTISVAGLKSDRGTVLASLYASETGFAKSAGAALLSAPIPPGNAATIRFAGLAPGLYAVLLVHDENGNGRLDTGPFGIPREPYGASNDPKRRMGPPRWRDCKFLLTGAGPERMISIRMN